MPKRSAGILLYRRTAAGLEVLLAHPGGPYWARKDEGAWSIPKGEPDEAKDGDDLLATARREFEEEMGVALKGEFVALQPCRQAGGKLVSAWALEADFDTAELQSNLFSMEWPPRSGRQREFPEVDRAAWFPVKEARLKILKGQLGFLDQLMEVE